MEQKSLTYGNKRKQTSIRLRPFLDGDIPLYSRWLASGHVARWYEHPEDWLEEVEKRSGEFSWLHHYIVTHDGTDVGFCQWYDCRDADEDWYGTIDADGTYSIDYMIGDTAYIGKGYGTMIIRSLLDLIAAIPGAKRVIAQPDSENAASCNTLLSAGFRFDEANQLYVLTF